MNSKYSYDAIQALLQARDFLRSKDNLEATRWAKAAVALEPLMEEGWLILAACAEPQESIQYLNQALKINPTSQRARQGMAWAVKRLRESQATRQLSHPAAIAQKISGSRKLSSPTENQKNNSKWWVVPAGLILAISLLVFSAWVAFPAIQTVFAKQPAVHRAQGAIEKATITHQSILIGKKLLQLRLEATIGINVIAIRRS
ncbi:MAG: hypothetical protein HGB14_09555, partial [Anaerolineaceae bacterium]|nr:hypothetical protein [Anaerolineaceae bacterium]